MSEREKWWGPDGSVVASGGLVLAGDKEVAATYGQAVAVAGLWLGGTAWRSVAMAIVSKTECEWRNRIRMSRVPYHRNSIIDQSCRCDRADINHG